ncbi:MAG: hypothetical protein KAQ65_11200, partial [Candidatus Thorarchaeota archaeon]|nr:hypothetical protein [Candidatus Thorarchaeota archaeon]
SWEEGLDSKTIPEPIPEVPVIEETLDNSVKEEDPIIEEPPAVEPTSRDLSWETPEAYSAEIKEGMPFKEVAPPTVVDEDIIEVTEAREHLFTDAPDEDTREAVTHLFPHGRGETSTDFIDIVVGKPKRIGADISPSILETPTCPDCGSTIGSDSFEYPPYVYEAMGKARMAQGIHLLKELDHESAIEQFEIAKKLFEHGGHKKLVDDATKYVDIGYDAMAEHHYIQAENHLKEKQYEWAIVQFKKARELYMFSTDAKKRAKCSHRARDAYEHWGKSIEEEGDKLSKSGQTRDALAKYTEAAEKYREADVPKKLRGLEKKIRNA